MGATRDGTLFEEQRHHFKYNFKSSVYSIPASRKAGMRKSSVFSRDPDFPSKMPYLDNLHIIMHLVHRLLSNINTYI